MNSSQADVAASGQRSAREELVRAMAKRSHRGSLSAYYKGTYRPAPPSPKKLLGLRVTSEWMRWSEQNYGAAETLRIIEGVRAGDEEVTDRYLRELSVVAKQLERDAQRRLCSARREIRTATRGLARSHLARRQPCNRCGHAPRAATNTRGVGSRRTTARGSSSSSDKPPGEPPDAARRHSKLDTAHLELPLPGKPGRVIAFWSPSAADPSLRFGDRKVNHR